MECVIYTRISMDKSGKGEGVERQEAECRALAERIGFTVRKVYSDNDISATNGRVRPDFEAMLKSKPTAIVAWHQDRLLRLTRDLERVIALNVPVYTVTAGTLDLATPAGRAVARTVAAWSQYEGEQKATRQIAANVQRAGKGIHVGRTGYGYRRVGTSIALHHEEAETIRSAAERVLNGESLRSICKELNARGVPSPRTAERCRARKRAQAEKGDAPTYLTPDPLWTSSTLKQMLLRPSLAGLTVHRGEVVGRTPDDAPRIIDEDTHELLKAQLNDPARRTAPAGRTPKYLLGGIARCGRCGGTMARQVGRTTTTKKDGTKRQPPSYVCSECYRVRRKQEHVDALVEGIVVGRLQMPDASQLFNAGNPAAVDKARSEVASADAKLANAADLFANGSIDGAQLARITEHLRAERERASTAVADALPAAIPADLIGVNAREVWDALSMDSKRDVLNTLVTVTIMPSGSGKSFDPNTIQVRWRN